MPILFNLPWIFWFLFSIFLSVKREKLYFIVAIQKLAEYKFPVFKKNILCMFGQLYRCAFVRLCSKKYELHVCITVSLLYEVQFVYFSDLDNLLLRQVTQPWFIFALTVEDSRKIIPPKLLWNKTQEVYLSAIFFECLQKA